MKQQSIKVQSSSFMFLLLFGGRIVDICGLGNDIAHILHGIGNSEILSMDLSNKIIKEDAILITST